MTHRRFVLQPRREGGSVQSRQGDGSLRAIRGLERALDSSSRLAQLGLRAVVGVARPTLALNEPTEAVALAARIAVFLGGDALAISGRAQPTFLAGIRQRAVGVRRCAALAVDCRALACGPTRALAAVAARGAAGPGHGLTLAEEVAIHGAGAVGVVRGGAAVIEDPAGSATNAGGAGRAIDRQGGDAFAAASAATSICRASAAAAAVAVNVAATSRTLAHI